MRNRKAILGSAILAVAGFGLASLAPAQTQSTPGQTQNQRSTNSTNRLGSTPGVAGARDSMDQIKGVQELFARVTDAAVKQNDFTQLKEYFSKEEMNEHHSASGANASSSSSTSGGTSGLSARAGTSNSTGTSGSRTGTSGTSGTSGTARNESSANNQSGTAGTASARESRNQADIQSLNQCVQQFEQAWKQKYGSEFRIQDPTLVYADVTAADIMAGQAQAAGSQLRGSGLNSASGNSTTHQPGSSSSSGTSGTTGSAAHSGTSTSGARANSDSSAMNEKEMTINAPAVAGSQAVSVRVVREGSNYKFAGNPNRLPSSLEKHLKEATNQKDRWPADQKQAERLVTQHVLMAISEVQMHHGNENAQPAGERIRGQSGLNNSTTGTKSGSTSGGTSSGR